MVLTRPPFLSVDSSLSSSYRDLRLFLVYRFYLPLFRRAFRDRLIRTISRGRSSSSHSFGLCLRSIDPLIFHAVLKIFPRSPLGLVWPNESFHIPIRQIWKSRSVVLSLLDTSSPAESLAHCSKSELSYVIRQTEPLRLRNNNIVPVINISGSESIA